MPGIGSTRHRVTFQTVVSQPDGDGGTIDVWTDLNPPEWDVLITPATVRDLERDAASTIIATATHVIGGRYRGDVTVDCRMLFQGREFRITGVKNIDERGIAMQLFAKETI